MSVARTAERKPSSTPGYSGKPLALKLGLAPGLRVHLRDAPDEYWLWCALDPASVTLVGARQSFEFGHLFVATRAVLARGLKSMAAKLEPGGTLWISWPKKASGIRTDLTEDALRECALPLGVVDVKVCAVSEVWSGLKFVWRRDRR